MREPHFGFTRHGLAVHLHTADHHRGRLNKRVAVTLTRAVGSMWCAYVFCLLALASLPAVLQQVFRLHFFPQWLVNASLITLVAWVAQTLLQLVLLPVIIVGQNVQAEAGDARAAKTFEDGELILDRLDLDTKGGLAIVLAEAKRAASAAEAAFAGVQALAAVATAKPRPAAGGGTPAPKPRGM
jgi:hypothetical protein